MKKSLLAVAMLLVISSKQMFACDYYEDNDVLDEIIDIGTYKSNVSGVVCSHNTKNVIPIKDGKIEGLVKWHYESGELWYKANVKNGKAEGLYKAYYETGELKEEGNYKNSKREGLWKYYDKSGALREEINYKNGKLEGLWRYYDESGKLKKEENYKNGERIDTD